MRKRLRRLTAADAPANRIQMATGGVALRAADDAGDAKEPRRVRDFDMVAYDGGTFRQWWLRYPVVVNLSGMAPDSQELPILWQHQHEEILGQSVAVEIAKTLKLSGKIFAVSDQAKKVIEWSDLGFKFQASIGADPDNIELIPEGESVQANGRTFKGPVYYVAKSRLAEVSFVTIGAARNTRAKVAASLSGKGTEMNFEEWLRANGFDPATVTDDMRPLLMATYTSAMEAAGKSTAAATKEEPAKKPESSPAKPKGGDGVDLLADFREGLAVEEERVALIKATAAEYPDVVEKHPTLVATAIREKWDTNKVKLEFLLKDRPPAPAIHAGGGGAETSWTVVEAALCQTLRLNEKQLLASFDEKTLEVAHKKYRGRAGLQQVIFQAAQRNGYLGDYFQAFRGDLRNVLRAAFPEKSINAAFSTNDIADVLSNTANKFALQAFMSVEQVWRMLIPGIRNVNDFKQITSYRLTGDMTYEKLPPTGEIPHAKLGNESYTNKIDTYAKMMGIPREDIINDDLGVLEAFPRMLARGAALKVNDVFWTEFLADHGTFFTTGQKNYKEGAGTAFGATSLTDARAAFRTMKDSDGKLIAARARYLLVPAALEVDAETLMTSTGLNDTTATKVSTTSNPHRGKFEVISSAYLDDNSVTAWYLLADPNDLPMIEVAALNGNIEPTIESAEVDFNQLGIQFRGYNDFGVAKQDYRGIQKRKGAA